MKLLSIIIPIYNVEPYVERCIRSLEDQSLLKDEYEIICINDGSPDNSKDVVQRLQKEFDNIVLIDQENQGVSMARNNGIDIAKGKYLFMIDPDDYVKPNSLKEKLDVIFNNDLDVGITGYIILDEKGEQEYCYDSESSEYIILPGIDYDYKYLWGKSEIRDPHRSVAIFYKANFLNNNNLRYISDVPYLEDGEFINRVMCLAKRVMFLYDPFYMRTTRPGSATHSNLFYSKKAGLGFLKAAVNLLKFKEEQCISKKQKTFMNQPIFHFTILYILSYGPLLAFKSLYNIKKNLKKASLLNLQLEGLSKTYILMAKFYNCSILCFLMYYNATILFKSFTIRINRLKFLNRG